MTKEIITCIYKITNHLGEIYIGRTTDLKKRLCCHKTNSIYCKTKVSVSIGKYGWKRHKTEILHHLPNDISNKDLNRYERLYISFYKNAEFPLLNWQVSGKKFYMTDEVKKKMSEAQMGPKNHRFGKRNTPETIQKIQKSRNGYVHTQETKDKISKSHKPGRIYKGTPHTEEWKRQLSINLTRRWELFKKNKKDKAVANIILSLITFKTKKDESITN